MTIKNMRNSTVLLMLTLASLASAQSADVPFEFIHNEIVVKVMIDGKGPYNALIDTGTDPSAVDIKTAKQIDIKLDRKGRKSAGSGTEINLNYACKFTEVSIGTIRAADVEAAAIDLSRLSDRMGVQIDAILGYSFLRKRIVQFDYPRSVIRFFERSPIQSGGQRTVTVPFRYKDNVLIEGVTVNGRAVTANLDTGSSGAFQLSPQAVKELGLSEEAARGVTKRGVGYNGTYESREGIIKNISIGSISIDNAPVTFLDAGTGHDDVSWSINIGNGFMKDFVVTVDYVAKKVTFSRP
jgi:predicted aspartyl protease